MKVAVIYNKGEIEHSDVIDIFGPSTKERYNPTTIEMVATALEEGGHNVKVIEGNIRVADELSLFMPRVIAGERPGLVFNMAYGIQGQSRYTHIPAMLEMLGIPYVGSGPQAHAVSLDKVMSKIVFQQHNLPTPDYWLISSPEEEQINAINFPVIVKPKMEAVSMGLEVVHTKDDLYKAIQHIINTYKQQALVEQFIAGREFAVGLLGNGQELEILPIVEFDFKGNPDAIQSYTQKTELPVEKICPASISQNLQSEMERIAREAFTALGIHDFARIDLRMDAKENIAILELNSMASLGKTGSYLCAAKTAGYNYRTLVNRMLDVAATRYFGKEYFQVSIEGNGESIKAKPLRIRLRSYLRANLTTMVDYLQAIMKIDTYVYDTEGVNTLGNWITSRLRQLGFNRQVLPQAEVGNTLYFSNHDDASNDILIIGHLDTFYRYQERVPFREEQGRFYGSGVAESKGGLVVILGALQALRYTRQIKKIHCGVLLISDDSLGGRFSKKFIREYSEKSKYILGVKYGGKAGGIVTASDGRMQYIIEMSNTNEVLDSSKDNIISAISQKIVLWEKLSSSENGIVVKPRQLKAHTTYGSFPDYATVTLDIQFREEEQVTILEEEIRKIARKGLNATFELHIKKEGYWPSFTETEASKMFFNRVKAIAERIEVRAQPIHRKASSAVSHVPLGIPVLEGLGPAGGDSRSPNEYILRDSLIDRAVLLALIIRETIKEPTG